MRFDFDPEKSAANFAKHGIDFESAQALWLDERGILAATGFLYEDRILLIGKIDGKHWTAVFTYRGNHIRLISARRSRKKEALSYDHQNDQR